MKRKSPSHSSSQFAFSSSFSSEPSPSSSDNPVEHQSNIKIAVRIRPESAEERTDKKHRLVVKAIDEKLLIFDPEERDGVLSGIPDNYNKPKDKKFAFDIVFDQYATQRQVKEKT
ncbi:MAG: hypothetical protein J0L85_17210 [Zoogloea sp.]|nr:hypothetical protein [Zoogloea sp.]